MSKNYQSLNTKFVHAGESPDAQFGAIAPLLVRTKTFRQPEFGVESAWAYSRGKNPTRSILEKKLELILGQGQATVFGSGDAATTMLLFNFLPGDHIICGKELYGGTVRLLEQLFKDYGILVSHIDVENEKEVAKALKPTTKAIFVETITNPSLNVTDLTRVSKIAKKHKLEFVVDATFTPPSSINPFYYGADTVLYSLSKYFGGHNDCLGGALITKNKKWHERHVWLQWSVGALLSPDESYRFIQELKTLGLRWRRVSDTADEVAKFLQSHPKIKKVNYPALKKQNSFDAVYAKNGFGGVISLELNETRYENLKKFVTDIQKNEIIVFAESLASPETIISHPATMSHRSLSDEKRQSLGISKSFFRLSVGFEGAQDIIKSLESSLKKL